jgi:hypothetical protein
MATGISAALAQAWLGTLTNVPWTAPITAVQLHTGQPGASGTANASAVGSRQQCNFVLSGNTLIFTGAPPTWSVTSPETIALVSVWSDLTAGTFLFSGTLLAPQTVASGDTFTLNAITLPFLSSTIAA